MKKLSIIIAAMTVLFSFQTLSAQQTEETNQKTQAVVQQDEYKQVEADKISEIIKAAVEKDFPGTTITEAYTDKIGNYKLVLTIENDIKTVYTNNRGEWFDPGKKG